LVTLASSASLSMSSPLFMVAPFSGRLLCSGAAVSGLLTSVYTGAKTPCHRCVISGFGEADPVGVC
jgi:hypothetical protein